MATPSSCRLDLALGKISFEEFVILLERLRETENGIISSEEYETILEKLRKKK